MAGPAGGRHPDAPGRHRPPQQLTVAEITSAGKGYPTEVTIGQQANLTRPSFVQFDNVQTVANTRFVKYLGALDSATMGAIGRRLLLALGLEDGL